MVWPTLVDMHTHLDKGEVIPRVQANGTIRDAALKNREDHARWTPEDVTRRMRFALRCAYVQGVSAIRTHLDSLGAQCDITWPVFRELRDAWAGRIALLNQQLNRKVGFLNPQLYPLRETTFFDITSGDNGAFAAQAGWDACTGLGSPNGQALLTALRAVVATASAPSKP